MDLLYFVFSFMSLTKAEEKKGIKKELEIDRQSERERETK